MLALIPVLALAAAPALAHMEMTYPAPFRSKYNSLVPEASIDYSMTSPLLATGANYPCKGYNVDMGTAMGGATAGWTQGGSYNFTVVGSAVHGGGSCQASLSYDGGNTFKVIKSWIGNCPIEGSGNFDFAVPSDAPSGDAVFAWTWFNNIGNREMYMNCAHVTIASGSGSSKRGTSDAASYSSAPANFIANVGNGCSTEAGKDVLFPSPGSVVVDTSSGTAPPIGTCGAAGSADTSSSDTSSSSSSSDTSASSSSSSSATAGNQNLAATGGSSSSPSAAATTATDAAAAPAATSSAGTSKCQRKRKVKRALSPEAKRAIAEIEARDFAAQNSAAVNKRNMPAYAAEEARAAEDAKRNHSGNRVRRMGNIHGKRRFE